MAENALGSIPDYHFDSLKQIENGYWWYEGRLLWAKHFITRWLEANAFTEAIYYVDLGCGTGGFGTAIHSSFPNESSLLVDNNPEALKRISTHAKIQTLATDLESPFQLPFKPNLITCMDVIEHLKDDQKFLKEIYSCLKPGGLLVLSVPAHQFLYSAWDKALGHHRRYSKGTLIQKLESAGFKITSASYGWSFLFPAAPYRFFSSKNQEKLEYPKVSAGLNKALIFAAKCESKLASWLPLPFGTSVFVAASKE